MKWEGKRGINRRNGVREKGEISQKKRVRMKKIRANLEIEKGKSKHIKREKIIDKTI